MIASCLLAVYLSRAGVPPLNTWLFGEGAFTNIDALPYLRKGVQTHQFTSYDRAGDNYDADYFPIFIDKNGEQVLFDVYGPGCLYRLHANLWNGDLNGVNIRFYFDGEPKPRIDMDVTRFFSEANPLGIFKAPLAHIGQGWRFLYHPFLFAKQLRVVLSKPPIGPNPDWHLLPWLGRYDKHPFRRNHWYNFTYQTFTENPGFKSWSRPVDMSIARALWDPKKIGSPPIARHEPMVSMDWSKLEAGDHAIVFGDHGPGTITTLHFRMDPTVPTALSDVWLRITLDGAAAPQVEAPVGRFFGVYPKDPSKRIASMMVGCKGDDMYCYFPMPYWRSARVELINRGDKSSGRIYSEVDEEPPSMLKYPMHTCGYFHAIYHSETPRVEAHDYRYADLRGQGQIVGHFTYRWDTSMEEDERTYFDGRLTPSIIGEGFEDDHNQGWGLRDNRQAIWGSTASDGGAGAVWRFFIPDMYVFESAARHGHQVYGPHSPKGHEGMYTVGNEQSVTFAYMKDAPAIVQTDELDVGNPTSEHLHAYRVFGSRINETGKWWYDGEFNNVLFPTPPIQDDGVATVHGSEFRVKVAPSNHGVRLRRRTDKENNRQLAKVFVDGRLVDDRMWFSADFDHTFRGIRWFDSDFEIPEKYTRGKRSLKIRIAPVSSKTGFWDEYRYWAYSYR